MVANLEDSEEARIDEVRRVYGDDGHRCWFASQVEQPGGHEQDGLLGGGVLHQPERGASHRTTIRAGRQPCAPATIRHGMASAIIGWDWWRSWT